MRATNRFLRICFSNLSDIFSLLRDCMLIAQMIIQFYVVNKVMVFPTNNSTPYLALGVLPVSITHLNAQSL